MKKFYKALKVFTLLLLVLPQGFLLAQNTQVQIKSLLAGQRTALSLEESDILNWQITDRYRNKQVGHEYVYFQQYYQQLPIYNAISMVVIQKDSIKHFTNGFISSVSQKVNSLSPTISPSKALELACKEIGMTIDAFPNPFRVEEAKKMYYYDLPNFASSEIEVQLLYVPFNKGIRLAWNVRLEMKHEAHYWNIRVDAVDGNVLEKNDYTTECFHHEVNESDVTHSHPLENDPPPPPPPPILPVYHIFPYPIEAPSFGSRALLTDPSVATASPFGWHDVDGVTGSEYTITRGNNVFAYEDANADNLPGYSPDGGTTYTFDYVFTNGATPITNQDASITNLFYATNRIHDYLYQVGFDEESGNFQTNNYGNNGFGNDAVKAEAFDGSGTNNANFSTPPDGSAGRMQMFLWNGNTVPCSNLSISSVTYNGSMLFGTSSFSPAANVTANLILADDGNFPITDACSPILNNVAGKVVLIDRGGVCTFIMKAQAAQAAGAVGVIIANNVAGVAPTMTGSPMLSIPCLSVSQTDGNILKSALLSGSVIINLTTCIVNALDCSFDNGVIAHEYGHGLSNRLTGGPSVTGCLSNAEQGGEGWSDWLALMMTIEPGDSGAMARGIGTYLRGQPSNGAGIRRLPYSTNMSINPQTYATLATSTSVHQIGEVWCDVIWDLSWLLIEQFGFSSNPNNTTAGNNIAMRLVLEGMRLQPCSPGFLDARDAILTADALLYNNVHRCLLWQAFARRGMGFNASQGSSSVIGDEIESFTMPPFCLPATNAPIAAFTVSTNTIACASSIQCNDLSNYAFQWMWYFGDGTTSILQNPQHTYYSPGSYTIKLVVSNPLGVDSTTQTITVTPTFTVTANATPTAICGGDSVVVQASATGSNIVSYQLNSIPYAPLTGSGTTVNLADDAMSTARPIGFPFSFYGQIYTDFYICSNGFITFSPSMPANIPYGPPLPTLATPNNLIALAWNDLNPQNAGSVIKYFTTGTAPNRKLVVDYATSHYLSPSSPFVVQAILYEGSNIIDIHTTSITDVSSIDNAASTTQGIENLNGTLAKTVSGRNSSFFNASNDAFRFTPFIPYTFQWNPGSMMGATQTVFPIAATAYSVTVSDASGCSVQANAPAINILACPIQIQLTTFIQGFYQGGGLMKPVLFNQGVSTNQTICDSIDIEVRQAFSPYSVVASGKTILQINGQAFITLPILAGNYYVVVKHRNTNQTWSSSPIAFTTGSVAYNFSTAASQAYGNQLTQVDANVWALFTGDINQDENIDLSDYQLLDASINIFSFGYQTSDLNGDGNVDLGDTPFLEQNINNFIFSIHP